MCHLLLFGPSEKRERAWVYKIYYRWRAAIKCSSLITAAAATARANKVPRIYSISLSEQSAERIRHAQAKRRVAARQKDGSAL